MAQSPYDTYKQYEQDAAEKVKSDYDALKNSAGQAVSDYSNSVTAAYDAAKQQAADSAAAEQAALPQQYRATFDKNELQQRINERQLQERMNRLGLTDSGLNRTQQTAIAIQRGNADAAARLEQQQKTQELQDKIAQLIESGAAQKQQQEAAIRNDSANWYNNLLGDMYNNAVNMGYNQYNTDVAREDENKRWAEQLRQNELDRQAQLDAAKEQAAAAQKQAELEAFVASEKANLEADAKTQQQAFENAMKIVDALEKSGVQPEDIYSYLNGTGYMQSNGLLGNNSSGSGTTNSLADISVNSLDQKTKDSAYYRGNYLAGKISAGRMTKWEAVNDIIATYQDNFPAMKVAAEKAGVMNELLSRYR